jgi:hypothetical protein
VTLKHLSEIDIYILLPIPALIHFCFSIVPSLQPIMDAASFYPLPTKEALVKEFVGRSIKDVPAPAVILDVSKAKNNCARMLEACDKLGFAWRAHIKTHKVGMSRSRA